MKKVSYVIPCYRSEKTLPSVIEEIKETMHKLNQYAYEVILVNDSSPDNTWETIQSICAENGNGFICSVFGIHIKLYHELFSLRAI